MENKNQEIITKPDHTTDPSLSSAATSAAAFSGEQINPATHSRPLDVFDMPCDDDKFDIMEMLSNQNYFFPTTSTIFDVIGAPSSVTLPQALHTPPPPLSPVLGVSSEMVHTPATPNSTSISSSSNEAATEDMGMSRQIGADEEDQKVDDKSKKLLKPKKTMSTKKQNDQKFAFRCKSDIDNMEDGFKWRKYGQKNVKNSPFPRNYYRCTSAGCGVKKRVERSAEDPGTVITTYEGNHTHASPAPRVSMEIFPNTYSFWGSVSSDAAGHIGVLGDVIGTGTAGVDGEICGGLFSGGSISGGIGGTGARFSSGIGGAGSIDGRYRSGSFSAIGGSYSSAIGGASADIFKGSLNSGRGGNSRGGIADYTSGTGMISGSAYNAAGAIGSRAMDGGGIGGSSISGGASHINSSNYAIERIAPNRSNYVYNTADPSLSSYNFGAVNIAGGASATTTSPTTGSGSSSANHDSFPFSMYQRLAMFQDRGLLQDMVPQSHMQVKDQE